MITPMYAIRFEGILFSKLPLTRRIQLPGYLDRKSNQPLGSFTHPCITSESVTKEDYDQAKWIDHFFFNNNIEIQLHWQSHQSIGRC